jgi:hypothetical protein
VTRLPLLPIAFLLASASVGALVYERTRPVKSEEAVVRLDRVAEAVASTSTAKSFTFTYSATISAAGRSLTMRGAGAYDLARKLGALTLRVDGVGLGPQAGQTMEFVFDSSDGFVEYMRVPLLTARLPAGKSWVKIDVGELAEKQGVDLSSLTQGDQADPAKFFTFLRRTANPTVVGHEKVGGVQTTHYSATVDLRRVVATETDESKREAVRQMIEKSGISSFPADVWVDDAGYLRRMHFALSLRAPAERAVGTMTMTEELSNFGDPVNVAVPPESSVVDLSALAS